MIDIKCDNPGCPLCNTGKPITIAGKEYIAKDIKINFKDPVAIFKTPKDPMQRIIEDMQRRLTRSMLFGDPNTIIVQRKEDIKFLDR